MEQEKIAFLEEITKLWLLWSVPEAHHFELFLLPTFSFSFSLTLFFGICRHAHEHVMYFPSSCNTDNRFQLYRKFIADFPLSLTRWTAKREKRKEEKECWKIAFKSVLLNYSLFKVWCRVIICSAFPFCFMFIFSVCW